MAVPVEIKRLLQQSGGVFRGVGVSDTRSAERIIATVVRAEEHLLMLICREGDQIDLVKVATHLRRPLKLLSNSELKQLIPATWKSSTTPPLPSVFKLKAIVDSRVQALDRVTFASGHDGVWIDASRADFTLLLHKHAKVAPITADLQGGLMKGEQLLQQLERVEQLPALPGIAAQLISLKNNPYSSGAELVAIVQQDPAITAQLIRYANSPLYGMSDNVTSLERAVNQVLGFDFVVDLVFGLSIGRSLRMERSGALGLDAFWYHSLSCATLTHSLIQRIDFGRRPQPSVGYLAGLLHNIGLLLLGDQFPESYQPLNRAVTQSPDKGLEQLEHEHIGVAHTEIGRRLMVAWGMPEELVTSVAQHHNPAYQDDYAIYANLVFISDNLLSGIGIGLGGGELEQIPAEMLLRVGLTTEKLEQAVAQFKAGDRSLKEMARRMVS